MMFKIRCGSSFIAEARINIRLNSKQHIFISHRASSTEGVNKSEDPNGTKTRSTVGPKRAQLSNQSRETRVPSSVLERLGSYGGLVASVGFNAITELAKRNIGITRADAISGQSSVVFNEANANKIVETLCKVRGAVLKLGQMLSIQDSSLIDPRLAKIFDRVRQSADYMPSWQVEKVLNKELGHNWETKFDTFSMKPFAAASIGQVHEATLPDGKQVAVKLQYPGVDTSIDSDIKALTSLLRVWNFLPKGLYVENLIESAREDLAREVNYLYEAEQSNLYREKLGTDPDGFVVPKVVNELTTRRVLVNELMNGIAVDKLDEIQGITWEIKNSVAKRMLKLTLREVFEFRLMQTDPNWSNFLYDIDEDRIVLLDFGAARSYSEQFVDDYLEIIKAAAARDANLVYEYSKKLGFLTGYETRAMKDAHVNSVMILGESFAYDRDFDFGSQDMTFRIQETIPTMIEERLTPPPEETYSLHRKMSGIFLLCARLKAKFNCKTMFDNICTTLKKRQCDGQDLS